MLVLVGFVPVDRSGSKEGFEPVNVFFGWMCDTLGQVMWIILHGMATILLHPAIKASQIKLSVLGITFKKKSGGGGIFNGHNTF